MSAENYSAQLCQESLLKIKLWYFQHVFIGFWTEMCFIWHFNLDYLLPVWGTFILLHGDQILKLGCWGVQKMFLTVDTIKPTLCRGLTDTHSVLADFLLFFWLTLSLFCRIRRCANICRSVLEILAAFWVSPTAPACAARLLVSCVHVCVDGTGVSDCVCVCVFLRAVWLHMHQRGSGGSGVCLVSR